jgi:DNA-directed RNA polymerase II subunit RPB9
MRHEIASSVGDTAGITQDVAQDPTVGLSQSLSQSTLGDAFPGFCTMCGQDIVCEDCGEETVPGLVLEADDEDTLPADARGGVDEHSSQN